MARVGNFPSPGVSYVLLIIAQQVRLCLISFTWGQNQGVLAGIFQNGLFSRKPGRIVLWYLPWESWAPKGKPLDILGSLYDRVPLRYNAQTTRTDWATKNVPFHMQLLTCFSISSGVSAWAAKPWRPTGVPFSVSPVCSVSSLLLWIKKSCWVFNLISRVFS